MKPSDEPLRKGETIAYVPRVHNGHSCLIETDLHIDTNLFIFLFLLRFFSNVSCFCELH